MLASVTRLQLRSWWYLLPFLVHASRSLKQAQGAAGCRNAITRKTRGLAFWTLSLWEDEVSLKSYLRSGAHRDAAPKLFPWCEEAATTHWTVKSAELPAWEDATRMLQQQGRIIRVQHPTPAQREGRINLA